MPLWHERAMLAVWLWLAFDAAAWLLVECGLELVMVDRRMDAFCGYAMRLRCVGRLMRQASVGQFVVAPQKIYLSD